MTRHPFVSLLWAALLCLVLAASAAHAHGPAIKVSYAGARPEVLTIVVGQTVHFQNVNTGAGTCTLVGDNGAFESPTLARREGWHHTFETPGEFPYRVKELPGVKGTVQVVSE